MKKIVNRLVTLVTKTLQILILTAGMIFCANKLWAMRDHDYGHLTQYPGIPDNPVVLSSNFGNYMFFTVILLILGSTAISILERKIA